MNKLALVAYYGQKLEPLLSLFHSCMHSIHNSSLAEWYIPYSFNQIHATIIGLEWFEDAGKIVSMNYYNYTGKKVSIIPDTFPIIIDQTFPVSIKLGGFSPDYKDFMSFGKIPYERSFQINRETNKVVLVGWPYVVGKSEKIALANLRSRIEKECNIAPKYRNDNDLYFVLGEIKIPDGIDKKSYEQLLLKIEADIRNKIYKNPVDLTLTIKNLSLVSYTSSDLNETTSVVFPIETHYKNLSALINQLQQNT